VINSVFRVGGVREEFFEFGYEAICVSEIERTKISEEWLIDKILIDAEVVGTWLIPWGLLIRNPVEFIYVL
jgi:hypothetical protein